jgi:hypothetical protein
MLLVEARRAGWSGTVFELGRQSVYLTERELEGERGPLSRWGRLADDRRLFEAMGFSGTRVGDVAGEGRPTDDLDLNLPVPEHLRGGFDAVFDGGTLGLVFDVRAALTGMHDLLAVGGRAIHIAASNNYVDAGFHMTSPALLHQWYTGSGYEVELCCVVLHSRRWARGRVRAWDYEPGLLHRHSLGGFEQGMMLTILVARKQASSQPTVPYFPGGSRLADLRGPTGDVLRRLVPVVRPLRRSRVVRVGSRPLRHGTRW